jgi:hypothetical protein
VEELFGLSRCFSAHEEIEGIRDVKELSVKNQIIIGQPNA